MLKQCLHNGWFIALSLTAVLLMIASFIVPPTGVIDPSVLAGVGEIFAFASLGTVIKAIDRGTDASISHGNTTINIDNKDNTNAN